MTQPIRGPTQAIAPRAGGRRQQGGKMMDYALLASFILTVVLGMWATWRATP